MILWYFGFHAPYWRNLQGKVDPRGWLGHCEAWGVTEDRTWLFIDPQGQGTHVAVEHRHDEVQLHLAARFDLCQTILRLPYREPRFAFPLHGPMTCASVCGALVGVRALLPATLHRRLLAIGAEVIHDTQGRRSRPA